MEPRRLIMLLLKMYLSYKVGI